jgi:hypothetical protein
MGGAIGKFSSAASKKSRFGPGGMTDQEDGISILDPLQLGPAMFDKPADPPKPAPAPPPPDTSEAVMKEMSRAATDRELRKSGGRSAAFQLRGGRK